MRTLGAVLLTVVSLFLVPLDAFACGGLFCAGGNGSNGPQSVNQTAERIIFSQNDDGTVTAIVQILYAGPTDRFGWVLPVEGIPEVGVSTDAVFVQLQNATNPTFQLTSTVEGSCGSRGSGIGGGCADSGALSGNDDSSIAFNNANNSVNNITVVNSGSVGPYDFVVLQVDPDANDGVQAALDWLESNNYEATNVGPDLLQPYIDEGYNLLATRLQKSQTAGAIRPLMLTYEGEHPMIPIKLTAVAANDDMGVLVWVLGDSRSVPLNYKLLELNDTLIDWWQPQATYDAVVGLAANEASGQGFVTEYADSVATLGFDAYSASDESTWNEIIEMDWSERPRDLVNRVISEYGNQRGWDGLSEAIDTSFRGQTSAVKARIQECGACAFEDELPEEFSIETFLMAVDDFVVGPVRDTQELFDNADYITRLYTNLSPEEMTLDPSFGFNDRLPDVDNNHVAQQVIECDETVTFSTAPWRVEVPSGFVVRGTGTQQIWPLGLADTEMPATISVQQWSESGDGEVVRDNLRTIRQLLDENNVEHPSPDAGGCAALAPKRLDPWFLFVLIGLAVHRRRLRRR